MSSQISCPVCYSSCDKRIVHPKLRYGHPGSAVECLCGLVFLHPRHSEEEQKSYYIDKYRDDYEDPSPQERFFLDYPEATQRMERILPYAKDASSLLEIGSGSGAFLSVAQSYFKKAVGIELDSESRDLMSLKKMEIYKDLSDLKKFDLIVLFHVLEHILDPISFLKNLKNHLIKLD